MSSITVPDKGTVGTDKSMGHFWGFLENRWNSSFLMLAQYTTRKQAHSYCRSLGPMGWGRLSCLQNMLRLSATL